MKREGSIRLNTLDDEIDRLITEALQGPDPEPSGSHRRRTDFARTGDREDWKTSDDLSRNARHAVELSENDDDYGIQSSSSTNLLASPTGNARSSAGGGHGGGGIVSGRIDVFEVNRRTKTWNGLVEVYMHLRNLTGV